MNILAFFAHPDDETMLSGGTLALLAQSGAAVHFVSATRGEGGEVGEPSLCTREELGQVRESELVCAVQALRGRSLTFLGYVDPTVGPEEELYAYSDDLTLLSAQVTACIRQFNTQVVFTHGSDGEYGHPAHLLTYQAARIAVEAMARSSPGASAPILYTAAAAFPEHPRPRLTNPHDPAHLVVNVDSSLAAKTSAAMCHHTQHALFVRRASQEAGRSLTVPEVIIPLEGLHRSFPFVDGAPDDIVARLLQPYLYKP